MIRLPLYEPHSLSSLVEETPGLDVDPSCTRCKLGSRKGVRVCVPPEGDPGGLLVIGESPGQRENDLGRSFVGSSGVEVRRAVQKHWHGAVAYDTAVRCFPGRDGPADDSVDACRGFLSRTLEEVQPQRVLALGALSVRALVGRSVQPLNTRRGYTYLPGALVPVFYVMNPIFGIRNPFVMRWWRSDMEWALTCAPPQPPPWNALVHVVETAEDAERAVGLMYAQAAAGRALTYDCETAGYMFETTFRCISLAVCMVGSDTSWVWGKAALADEAIRAPLLRVLADPSVKKAGQYIKYDNLTVRAAFGVEVRGTHSDVRLWRKLMDSEADGHLEVMSELVGMGGHKGEAHALLDIAKKEIRVALGMKNSKKPVSRVYDLDPAIEAAIRLGDDPSKYLYAFLPDDVLSRYNARDAVATARLCGLLEPRLAAQPELQRTWDLLIGPAASAIEDVEAWGVHCDPEAVKAFQEHLRLQIEGMEHRFAPYHHHFDDPGAPGKGRFNPSSPMQVGRLLYEIIGLPIMERTASGSASTSAETLEALKTYHPLPADVLDWRRISKLKGTYADALYGHIRPDSRIHPNIKLDGARSGRTACDNPNLQNIPRAGTPEGKMARDCFSAPLGFMLVELDYSQLELRIAAMLSGDPLMIEIFTSGVDYHLRTAQMVAKTAWGLEADQITDEHRTAAKTINFGVLYGLGDEGLAAQIGCSADQAGAVRAAIMGKFKVLDRWIQAQLRASRNTGEAWTWWDGVKARCRSLWQIGDQDDFKRSVAEHSSWNTPIQGTASDFCIASLVACVQWIKSAGLYPAVKLVLPVHDSLLFEVREDLVTMVVTKAREIMLGWNSGPVPMDVGVKTGRAWGHLV
jgi:uracil-DNA glycosylase family 4